MITGTVAPGAVLTSSRIALMRRATPPMHDLSWHVELAIGVRFRTWTQNTMLRPLQLLDFLPHTPLTTILEHLLSHAVPLPLAEHLAELLFAANEHYHEEVQNTETDNRERAELILQRVPGFDIVAVQEVFEDDNLEQIIEGTTHVALQGPDKDFLETRSGLALLVRSHLSPALQQLVDALGNHHVAVFEECNREDDDCLAQKGFTLDVVHLGFNPNHFIYVVNTHPQADDPDPRSDRSRDRLVRRNQFLQIKRFPRREG